MFRPKIDYSPWKERLLAQGRVQIPDILDDAYAEQFHAVLAAETEWALLYRDGSEAKRLEYGEYAQLNEAQRTQFIERASLAARGRYAYVYEGYSMIDRYFDAAREGHLLHHLVDVFHDERVLDFIRDLTNDPAIARVRIQATRYLPAHFLRRHDDTGYGDQNRRFAFVINLSRHWEADWGGLLHFVDAADRVVDVYVPRFNSLSLFKVPQMHYVSQVAPWAEEPRYAFTGWFMS
jgi:SM-20-related protein